jgi:hypothetical protein
LPILSMLFCLKISNNIFHYKINKNETYNKFSTQDQGSM